MPILIHRDANEAFVGIKTTAVAASIALALSGCQTMPQASGSNSNSAVSQYVTSCLTGALAGAAVGAILERLGGGANKSTTSDPKKRTNDLAKAALGGCVIGIAATAIGRVLNERQQAKHEEALQTEARRRALEQQQYEASLQRTDTLPARTAAERKQRDEERARLKAAYDASVNKPVTVDLGEGATSTIAVQTPAKGQPGATQGQCKVLTSLVPTPNGDVRQYDTMCPNGSGQYVRVDSQPNPMG